MELMAIASVVGPPEFVAFRLRALTESTVPVVAVEKRLAIPVRPMRSLNEFVVEVRRALPVRPVVSAVDAPLGDCSMRK